jgi:hypothetical protein
MRDLRRQWAWARAVQRYLEQVAPRNRKQLHRTLDTLKDDGVIHGWGRDRLTSRYTVAVTEEDRRTFLSTGDVWTLIGRLRP